MMVSYDETIAAADDGRRFVFVPYGPSDSSSFKRCGGGGCALLRNGEWCEHAYCVERLRKDRLNGYWVAAT